MKEQRADLEKRNHHSHWGAFSALVRDGRLVGVSGFEKDPDPSPIIYSIPDAVYSHSRITQPVVRAGWLKHGPGGNRKERGADLFVQVSWEKALDLVAKEIDRVKTKYGNQAIFGGSYGWSSAGCFHQATAQIHRFLNTIGGFTGQVGSYSTAAAEVILPHVLGTAKDFIGIVSTWDDIVRHTELMILFGGLPLSATHRSCAPAAGSSCPGSLVPW